MFPVLPEAMAKESELGRAEETGELDLTTEICELEPSAAQAFSEALVPVMKWSA